MKNFDEVYEEVKKRLSPERMKHSECVMSRCIEFATIYGENVEKAKLIGIAHDIAKEIPRESRVKIAEEHGIILDDFEKENTTLIHAKLGAVFCKELFEFTDDMCNAIAAHTTANINMSRLDKILYVSDYSEEGRKFSEAITAYKLGKKNLDEAYYYVLIGKIKDMLDKRITIHKNSINAYNDFIINYKR